MPVFTAAAAFIAGAIGVTSVVGIAAINFGVRVLATYVVSSLVSNRSNNTPAGGSSPQQTTFGGRVQLPPGTENKLPIVYGSAFVSPSIIDALISSDQKTMWYVMALTESTDTGTTTINRQWWGDKELYFDATDGTKVVRWVDSSDTENTNINGNMFIYYYRNGSNNPINSSSTAISVLQDSQIDAPFRWTSNHLMSNTNFAIVKIIYNQDAGTTGLEQFKVQMTNSLTKPGDVLYDYMSNSRYGCAIPINSINTDSLDILNTYSDTLISYITTSGGTATQPRYRINGPIATTNTCLTNLQQIIDACDSWLKWDEVNGQWSVTINRSYTDYTTYNDLFVISSDNLIGGIDVNPVDLNQTYNSVEAQFPNYKIKDQTDYCYIYVNDEDKSPNEPDNQIVLQLPQVNNIVQAKYLSTRRLIQSREDLILNFTMDYSGIQIEAGDVVRVRHPVYGWGPTPGNPTNPDKLFRVDQVIESKSEDGSLGARLSLIEYNDQVYQNISIQDFTPASNTGIPTPNWIGTPTPPSVVSNTPSSADIASFDVSGVVPTTGTVLYMDFYYGTTSGTSLHKLYKTIAPNTGRAFVNGATVTITVNDLPKGTYYWSVKARGAGTSASGTGNSASSDSSSSSAWAGAKVLAPAIIGGALVGGIALSMMQPGASGFVKFITYDPRSGGPYTVATRPSLNLPTIYPGATPANIYPWAQSLWASGGQAWTVQEGVDNWYVLISVDLSADNLDTSELGVLNLDAQFLTDIVGSQFEIARYARFSTTPTGDYVIQQRSMGVYTIPYNGDYPMQIAINGASYGSYAIKEWGYMIRNITPGCSLLCSAASITVKQNK
ncbi:hypothetical protein UFOVP623_27 [uncultured Caudovirales phage]|uniref:Tip attachment protein J n=1 Tax=uncultured Caudovirales phage TaxID=2100421 RepID=A0A6J5N5S7_9CAUD|nr:hypothetical protein UFOVP623_27 [uncultured Caudovirales phage]